MRVRSITMDAKAFFNRARQIEGTLGSKPVFITSVESEDGGREGQVCEATPKLASERIAAKTHRLSKDHEIQEFKDAQEARRQYYVQEELRTQKPSPVVLSESAMNSMAAGIAGALAGSQAVAEGGKQRAK